MAGGIEREGTLRDYKLLCEKQRLEIHRLNREALERERKWSAYLEKTSMDQELSRKSTPHMTMDRTVLDRQEMGQERSQRQEVRQERSPMKMDRQRSEGMDRQGGEGYLHAQVEDLSRELEARTQDLDDSKKVRTQILNRIEEAEDNLLRVAKLLDLLRDYDPEGVEDMRRLYQEIEGGPAMTEEEMDRRIYENDVHWHEKKRRMSERVKSLFDEAVSLEERRKRLRFERAAAFMWSMHPGSVHTHAHTYTHTFTCAHQRSFTRAHTRTFIRTHTRTSTHTHTHIHIHTCAHIHTYSHTYAHTQTRKERAIMESLHELDNERRKPRRDSTAFDPKDRSQANQHQLFARLLESEGGLGLLPSARDERPLPAGVASATFRRSAYDHSLQTRRSGVYADHTPGTPNSRSRSRASTPRRSTSREPAKFRDMI
jgi:hypothetical protein